MEYKNKNIEKIVKNEKVGNVKVIKKKNNIDIEISTESGVFKFYSINPADIDKIKNLFITHSGQLQDLY